jgi:hypothetical protein
MKSYQVARLLAYMTGLVAYMTGLVNQELLLQVESIVAETGSSGHMHQLGCGSRTSNAPRWPKSARGWGGRDWRTSP